MPQRAGEQVEQPVQHDDLEGISGRQHSEQDRRFQAHVDIVDTQVNLGVLRGLDEQHGREGFRAVGRIVPIA